MSHKLPSFIPHDMNCYVGCFLTTDDKEMVVSHLNPDMITNFELSNFALLNLEAEPENSFKTTELSSEKTKQYKYKLEQ